MFVKILITLFIILPPALGFAANPKADFTSSELEEHLTDNPNDPDAMYNLALNEQKNGNSALALALIEKSSFINPFNLSAIKLRSLSYDQLIEQSGERLQTTPLIFRILDFIPYFLILIACLVSILLFSFVLGRLFYKERESFKTNPQLRFKASLVAVLTVFLGTTLLLKSVSLNETWACVTAKEASLFTGPNAETYTKVSSLSAGTCTKVVLIDEAWISLAPNQKTSGWTLKSQVLIVRANKFDPQIKSD